MEQLIKTRKAFDKVAERGNILVFRPTNSQYGRVILFSSTSFEVHKIEWKIVQRMQQDFTLMSSIFYVMNPQKKEVAPPE